MLKHYSLSIIGYVQGVNFRTEAKKMADRFGVKGFAQNGPGGIVQIEAEGEGDQLQKFINWCGIGPFGGEVDNVQVEEAAVKGYDKFEVKY